MFWTAIPVGRSPLAWHSVRVCATRAARNAVAVPMWLGHPRLRSASGAHPASPVSPAVADDRFVSRRANPRNNCRCWDVDMSSTVSASSSFHNCSIRLRSANPAAVDSTSVARPSVGSGRRRTKPGRSSRCTVRVIEAESVSNSAARSDCRCGAVSHRCISRSSCPGCRPRPCRSWRVRITCRRVTRISALLTGPADVAVDYDTRPRAAGPLATLFTLAPIGQHVSHAWSTCRAGNEPLVARE
jgi:hypothetical protein